MSTNNNRKNAHDMIDHIFHDLLPARDMAERPEQVSLSHLMLDSMLDGSIALCDAGTGIGKTYSYLAAGAALLRFRAANGLKFQPVIVSTSSIALQNAVQHEYLPLLSAALMEDGLTDQPICAVIRKGKSHYVCDHRLERRLGQLDLSKKNWKAGRALLSLREQLDMDAADHIIPKEIFNRTKAEMARRASKRKVMQKHGKTEQGKYSAKYALTELLVCGECGSPYKRCTWARNGKKRIVWRCVSRLEFGTKHCRNSPTLDEVRLHHAILAALNQYGAIRTEIQESAMELAERAMGYGNGDGGMAALRQRLDELTAEQAVLLDKVLADMNNLELNAQLKAMADEKQGLLEQIGALQQEAERQTLQASRRKELEEWLAQQPMVLTEYDDGVTRRLVERIMVVDAETIRVKLRDTDLEIEQNM